MARVNFQSLFVRHEDGSLEPRQRIRIGGVEFGPGVRFTQGVQFAGIDLTLFVGHDFEIDVDKGVIVIKGIY